MNISALIASYCTDPACSYSTLRHKTRLHYDSLCRRIDADMGALDISEITTRGLLLTYKQWEARGVSMAHATVGILRMLMGYGATVLEDNACLMVSGRLRHLRFKQGKPRVQFLTAEQVVAVRRTAHAMGLDSIALAQAIQFEGILRQKDVVGEWMPVTEDCRNYLVVGEQKWWRGIRYEEISTDLVLTHITSKRQKEVVIDLKDCPMIMEELQDRFGLMSEMPRRGPVIISEATGLPYTDHSFRRLWRMIARKAGIPDSVRNMDTRSGAITEALQSGASLDAVRKAATHSDASMTQRYSRNEVADRVAVQRLRTAGRVA
jgi:hypothetical protein